MSDEIYTVSIETNLSQNENNITIELLDSNSIEVINNTTVLVGDLPQGYPLDWTVGNLPISRVSGLYIIGGTGINVLDNSGTYTISVTGNFGLTGEEVDDRIYNLLVAGNYTSLNYNDEIDQLIISITGLQPSGNYSEIGHSHVIADVSGLQNSLDSKQPSGNYASDIHYHTSSDITDFDSSVDARITLANLQPSGNYSLVGHSHNISDVSGLQSVLDSKQPSGNYSIIGHTHSVSEITDFNSGVSGLLPVKDISSGSGISVINNSGNFTVAVTGQFGLTSEQVDDRVNSLLVAGSYVNLNYNDNLDNLTISVTGVQPSGNYSLAGHSHTSAEITDFNTAVSGLIPPSNFTSLTGISGISVSNSGTNYFVSLSDPTIQLSDITDLSADARTFLLTPSSNNLQTLITNETGSGVLVFNDSPDFSGIPTVPTAPSGTNNTQIANTNFVRTEISNLVNSAPSTLDTLNELAQALGSDPNFATTVASGLAQKSNIGHTHVYTDITNFGSGVSNSLTTTLLAGNFINLNYDSNLDTLTISASGLQPSGNYSIVGHTHTSSNITDFNSSVSGLLPTIANSGDNRVLTSTGSSVGINAESNLTFNGSVLDVLGTGNFKDLNVLGEFIPDSAYAEKIPGTIKTNKLIINTYTAVGPGDGPAGSIDLYTIDGSSKITIKPTDYPATPASHYTFTFPDGSGGIVALEGHTHTTNDITDFNTSVSGLIPVKDIISGTGILVTSSSGIYTVNTYNVPESASIVTNVFNKTASTINKGSVVYINGGQGDQPTIQLAIAANEMGSSKTYGIVQNNIASMDVGKVVVAGALTGFNTDQFNPTAPTGDVNGITLWLSPTVSGAMTTTKPSAPYHMVSVGTIVRTHQNEGVVEVRIQNGFELEELHNVAISGVTNGQFLQYNSGSGLWVPSSSGNFTTLSVNGTGVSLNGHTHTSADITDFNEAVDDRIGTGLFVAGTGINLSYNDGSNSFTVSTSGLISNPTNNRILTSRDSTTTGIDAETNLVFTGTNLGVNTTAPSGALHIVGSGLVASITGTVPNSLFHIYSAVSGASIFNVEGTNGSLFSVDDNLSGTLMSVNNSAGLPVFEVFSDDRVIGGRYNQNDFVINSSGNIGIGNSGDNNYKLNISGNVNVSGTINISGVPLSEVIDDEVSSLLIAGTGISLNYNDASNILTISTTGLQPSGNYSLVGHSHTSLDITDFNSAVSGLIPSTSLRSDVSGVYIYTARAEGGTLDSDSTWFVRRATQSPSGTITNIENAIGAWSNRYSLIYS